MSVWVPSIVSGSTRRRAAQQRATATSTATAVQAVQHHTEEKEDKAKLLRQMDATIRCIVSLGRPSGCGMPGSVAAGPLSQLLAAAVQHMHKCSQGGQATTTSTRKNSRSSSAAPPAAAVDWSFIDIGAGAGRMLLAAAMFGAKSCHGIELCDLVNTFDACKSRCLKKGLLPPSAARSCTLHVGDASHYTDSTALLAGGGGGSRPATTTAGRAAGVKAAGGAAGAAVAGGAGGPVMVSLIDEGMPMCVREHAYNRVAQDARVCVVITVNYRSRAGHLPSLLSKGGFSLVEEMPAPLMGGKCSTAGRIYVRSSSSQQQRVLVSMQEREQQQQQEQAACEQVLELQPVARRQRQRTQQQQQQQAGRQQQPPQSQQQPQRQQQQHRHGLRERSALRPAWRYQQLN